MTSIDIFKLSDVYKYKKNGDDPDIPQRFLNAFPNKKISQEKWEKTIEWRLKYNIDNKYIENGICKTKSKILSMKCPYFKELKKYFPTIVLGLSKNNLPVIFEKWGNIDFKKIRELNIKTKHIIWYYLYCMEWLWIHHCPDENKKLITIIDVNNLVVSDFLKYDGITIFKTLNKIFGNHYVERTYRIILINFPPVLYKIYNMLIPFVSKEHVQKLTIHPKGDFSEIHKYVDINLIPKEYGGKNKENISENDIEKKLLNFVNLPR